MGRTSPPTIPFVTSALTKNAIRFELFVSLMFAVRPSPAPLRFATTSNLAAGMRFRAEKSAHFTSLVVNWSSLLGSPKSSSVVDCQYTLSARGVPSALLNWHCTKYVELRPGILGTDITSAEEYGATFTPLTSLVYLRVPSRL